MSMVTDQDIEDCLRVLARLCEAYGQAYWPSFELFETELEKRRSLLKRIRSYSTDRDQEEHKKGCA